MENLSVYLGVFAIVFLPYIFVSFFFNVHKLTRQMPNEFVKLPGMFRLFWRCVVLFEDSITPVIRKLFPDAYDKMKIKLVIANMKIMPDYVFALQFIWGLLFMIIGFLLGIYAANDGIIGLGAGFIGGMAGILLPGGIVSSRGQNRQEEITRSLPFSIDLIGAAMRSGIDFAAAIRYYVNAEKPDNELVIEFSTMLQELELGKTRLEALDAMAERIRTEEFYLFSAAVCHGLEVGASIVETMKIQAEEMRRRRFNLAERKAARAASAMVIPIMTLILPAMFVIIATPVIMRMFESGVGDLLK